MPYSLAAPVHAELLIRKSRFIASVLPAADRDAAVQVVAGLWRAHPDATHVCWALIAGGQSAAVDDGEPGGTAGRPMLEVLRHQDLDGVLACVVRYYGGIKLGAGGLVRAYTDAVAQALLGAVKVPRVRRCALRCQVPYAFEGLLRRELPRLGAVEVEVRHADQVDFRFAVDEALAGALVATLGEAVHGRIAWSPEC